MISSQKHKKRYFMPEIELYGLLIGIGRRDFFYFRSGFFLNVLIGLPNAGPRIGTLNHSGA